MKIFIQQSDTQARMLEEISAPESRGNNLENVVSSSWMQRSMRLRLRECTRSN